MCGHSDSVSIQVDHVGVCGFLIIPAVVVGNDSVSPEFSVSAWEAVTCSFHLFMCSRIHLESVHCEPSVF